MKPRLLLLSVAIIALGLHPVPAQSPCHVHINTGTGLRQATDWCESAYAAQTITIGGYPGQATVTLSGGLREEYSVTGQFGLYDAYSGRSCQGLPPRLDIHFSRKVSNVHIVMGAEPESGGGLDVTVADNRGNSTLYRMILGGFESGATIGGRGITHITISTAEPTWHWRIFTIEFDDDQVCEGTPAPSPTPTRSRTDDTAVAPFPYPSPIPTDSNFYGTAPPGAFSQTVRKYDGPITRDVDIDRVVGELKPDGTLKYPGELVSNGVVSRYATLRIPAYDVDFSAGERDHVLFNGVEIGDGGSKAYLQGTDKGWFLSEFQIPIELVRFGNRNPGSRPTAGHNEIEILVDEDGGGWRVAVAFPKIQFQAMAPVVMVHGNNSCGAYFAGRWNCKPAPEDPNDPMFIQPFIDKRIPFDNSINMPTDQVAVHADWLLSGGPTNKSIKKIAAEWGSRHVHIVAHSKGGIDVRHFLTWLKSGDEPGDLGVLSFTTLSSPHLGSVGADYQVAVSDASALGLALSQDNRTREAMTLLAPADKGSRALTVDRMRRFNLENLPRLPLSFTVDGETNRIYYYVIAADANLDGSSEPGSVFEKFHPEKFLPTITTDEARGINVPNPAKAWALTQVYRLLGSVHQVILEDKQLPVIGTTVKGIKEIPEPCWFLANDFAVSWLSAVAAKEDCVDPNSANVNVTSRLPVRGPLSGFIVLKNHATMSTASTADIVIRWIQQAQPIQ